MESTQRTQRHRTTALAAGALVALLTVAGCGASDTGAMSGSASDDKAAAAQGEGDGAKAASGPVRSDGGGSAADGKADGDPAGKADGTAVDESTPAATHVIRTTTMSIEVKSVPKAVAGARSVAEGSGGLVESEATERVDDTHDSSHLVLRVPEDRYEGVLKRLTGAGKLLSRTSEAKDVTDQVVDVESRVATQRASVERVRALMEKAERISDVVALEGELSSRQANLESLLAQRASLADRTSLATITLDLYEPETLATEEDDDPGFWDAVTGGWDAFVTTVRWIAMAIGATAPFLAAVALLLVVWRLAVRRRRVPETAAPAAPVVADERGENEREENEREEAGTTPAP
ncbi:DUF4349 domain-containing protein [Streptomyces sp. NBC_00102]|uniref:DUF4349 domain-containing protein n=1 Tax=Streptomyces sp. NBC_00102 TaxID=2975652 RepID=UPI002256287C|nr:DUF4349 domain-containing protein [Streptomyces sp. NBC_00102]MCX5400526.1 DUF4349 domain-containing protein [Streptomyces sp. NBC_00102]